MNFWEKLENSTNISITENGAVGFATTKSKLVDFNFAISSYRNRTDEEIKSDFFEVWNEDRELALKFLFFVRDIREGLGERRLFRVCISEIVDELDERVFDWIAKYGRYDDLFVFFDTKLEASMVAYLDEQIVQDKLNAAQGRSISLLAKWMPSINTSSKATKTLAKKIITSCGISEKEYRKSLSFLRGYLKVVEKDISANNWKDVQYEHVPSQANLKYKDAFLKHDLERRREYLESLSRGETKINSSTTFPHDIVHSYYHGNETDGALEAMWKSLPNYNVGKNILVVRDGSGSMDWNRIGNSRITALEVATALAIYNSEKCEGVYRDNFITFSSTPKLVSLKKYNTLRDKLRACGEFNECSNTNIEATFDLILKTAVENNCSQEELPDLLILSDMEFDAATCDEPNTALFETISHKFKTAGYNMPKLIFWNVCSRTNTIPVTQNESGVILVSGFSPAVLKVVLSGEVDPYKSLVATLNSERYKEITLKK